MGVSSPIVARGPAHPIAQAARVAGVGRLHDLDLVPGAALVRKDELAVLEGALGAADTEFFSLVKVERAQISFDVHVCGARVAAKGFSPDESTGACVGRPLGGARAGGRGARRVAAVTLLACYLGK